MLSHAIAYSSLVPPNLFILATLIGVLLAWRYRRFGMWLATTAACSLYLASTPLVAYWLIRAIDGLGADMPRVAAEAPPGAIVVLGGDILQDGGSRGKALYAGRITLERLAEAARLQRRLGLPILVSGGWIEDASQSLAEVMSEALERDFRAKVRWREDRSRNTWENADFSAAILRRAGVPAALVVTQPWHMARALWSFAAVGYPALPAPTPGRPHLPLSASVLLPEVPALLDSYYALHEILGLAWYHVAYRRG